MHCDNLEFRTNLNKDLIKQLKKLSLQSKDGTMANTNITNQRQVFVEEYVRSGDHLEAAKKDGYKVTHTLRNQACKLRRECADGITDELHRNFAEIAGET